MTDDKHKADGIWRKRIVGYADVAPDSLLANENNWRIHGREQQDALTALLGDEGVGFVQNIMVNKRSGEAWPDGERGVETVVDGHLRVMLALRHNQPIIPVTYVDLDPQEEVLVLASFDPVAAMAAADKQALDAVLRQVETESAAIQQLVAQTAEKAGLYLDQEPQEAPEAQIDRAEELRVQWGTERGQVWEVPSKSVRGKAYIVCDECGAEIDL